MKKLILAFALAIISLTIVTPFAPAEARVHARVVIGYGNYGYHYYPYGYPYCPYYYPYYTPPPVVYMSPPVYVRPPPVVYYARPPIVASPPGSILANQTSRTFYDDEGHTCRNYQSGSLQGIACLQPDGSWRVVQ